MDAIICIKTATTTNEILIENINKIITFNIGAEMLSDEFTATTESLIISETHTYNFIGSTKTFCVNGSEIIYVVFRK